MTAPRTGSPTGEISHAFAQVDAAGDAGPFVAYLDAQAALPFWRALKRESLAALALEPGDRAVDVGCGTGAEVRAMAAHVAPGGEAIGIDPSESLLAVARERAVATGAVAVRFELGRAEELPLADASVDAIRCERTLQHVADAGAAIAEIARVARPGAAVALVEPDWDTLVLDVDPPGVSRAVADQWRSRIPQPSVGRTLARLLRAAGFRGVTVRARTTVIESLPYADQQFDLTRRLEAAVAAGAVEREAAQRWLSCAQDRARDGRFLAAATYFLCAARRGPR